MKLHELGANYKEAFDDLSSNKELSTEIINDSLAQLSDDFNSKAVSVVTYTNGLDNYIDDIDAEINRLNALKKTVINKRDHFKEYLRYNMEETGISKIVSEVAPFWTITLPKPTKQLSVIEESKIPKKYFTVTVTKKLDRKQLLADLKKGEIVEGATTIYNKPNVRIK